MPPWGKNRKVIPHSQHLFSLNLCLWVVSPAPCVRPHSKLTVQYSYTPRQSTVVFFIKHWIVKHISHVFRPWKTSVSDLLKFDIMQQSLYIYVMNCWWLWSNNRKINLYWSLSSKHVQVDSTVRFICRGVLHKSVEQGSGRDSCTN